MASGKRLSRPVVVGIAIILVVAWIASGMLRRDEPPVAGAGDTRPMLVAAKTLTAEPVERVLVLQGQVEPALAVPVRARTSGQVDAWEVEAGSPVGQGEILLRLSLDDREARRQQTLARVRRAESEYAATRRLRSQNSASETELEAKEAELQAARASLEAIELEIENTRIKAPVAGVLNRQRVDRGQFVAVGEAVADVVNNDPLVAVVQVPQHQIARVETGLSARVRFVDGREATGTVRYVSANADNATRTFRVEVEVANPETELPSGISATVEIPTDEVLAHKVSPAIMSLDAKGSIGIKTIEANGNVMFHPVTVVRTDIDGVWVTGLPPTARLITTGHAFVVPGDTVRFKEPGGDIVEPAAQEK